MEMPSEESMIEDLRELEAELREKEEYRKANIIDLFIIYSTHCKIEKSKVKEKIEEYKKHLPDKTTYEEYKNGGMYSVIGKQTTYGVAIQVLQELLREE